MAINVGVSTKLASAINDGPTVKKRNKYKITYKKIQTVNLKLTFSFFVVSALFVIDFQAQFDPDPWIQLVLWGNWDAILAQ